jgi:transcriptional regulator with XRE-family HTH domain
MDRNRVREISQKVGMSQVELACRAHIASTNISSIECGRLAAWPKARKALARALKVPEAELFPPEGRAGSDGN